MKRNLALASIAAASALAPAGVVISEVFSNPPGSFDSTREYIELMGTPGMKLDGYGIALLNGMQTRFYPVGSIPPAPVAQEIDEFFSLDGLRLGKNGLLVIGVSVPTNYPLLADTNFQRWTTLYNGGLDTPGQLNNDGSTTLLLVRNRPGATQADPGNPLGLRWGKEIVHDSELVTPVVDPQDGLSYDQFGDGALDIGLPNNFGGNTLDLRGESTPGNLLDDLEVVDEVSFEHDRGWEYDMDGRVVDIGGSTIGSLPERRVHALDDPASINPDALTRVDYRTKGPGWPPAPGATGSGPGGNNWQDTATEQWIRGESVAGTSGAGNSPWFFFDNGGNADVEAVQPYLTQTPRWLSDGVGGDYDFSTLNTYQIMAGRVNPLAVAYIPGDADRDGDADADDIAKIAAVFGEANWIFSNSFSAAPQGNAGDPATQTRPWDVDGTGDNGIEPSDLQWTLNFQGDTTGRIIGVRYDSETPSTVGVHLNPGLPVVCEVTVSAELPPGRTLATLQVGDNFRLTAAVRVSSGANLLAAQENGVMQFVNDVAVSLGGVVRATLIEPLGAYATTRAALQTLAGASGDLGVRSVNGYTTSFTQALGAATPMYRVSFTAIGQGSASIAFSAATAPRLLSSTPGGLKVGHTDNNGDPGAVAYPVIGVTVVAGGGGCPAAGCDSGGIDVDLDNDCQVSLSDLALLLANFGCTSGCAADTDGNGAVDLSDLASLLSRFGNDCN